MRTRATFGFVYGALLALQGYAQRPGPGPANPFVGNEQAVTEGRNLYNRTCTACHGPDGAAGDRAPGLAIPGRRYIRNTDRDVFDVIMKGIPGTAMPPGGLAENDAWKVTAYLHALRGTAIDAPVAGDVAHGEQIFWGKADCGACHMLRGRGGLIGPDLTNVAGTRKLTSIRDAMTKPDHRVSGDGGRRETVLTPLPNYRPVRVVTRDGAAVRGVIRNEDSFSLQILGTDNALHMFSREELREIRYENTSLMPSDYDKQLTKEEFQDLLAFLTRQAVAPVAAPAGPRRGGQ